MLMLFEYIKLQPCIHSDCN